LTIRLTNDIKEGMPPQETLTRRQLFKSVLDRTKEISAIAALLAACGPSASPARVEPTPYGWLHFISSNHPYEIDYPARWTTEKKQVGGKMQDIFNGEVSGNFQTNVIIVSEPTTQSDEAYAKNVEKELIELKTQALRGAGGPLVGGYWREIAGQKASVFHVNFPKEALVMNPEIEFRVAVFVKDKRGWNIALSCVPSAIPTEERKFEEMLYRFKLR